MALPSQAWWCAILKGRRCSVIVFRESAAPVVVLPAFLFFRLPWVFIATCRPFLAAARGFLLLRSTDSSVHRQAW